GALRGESPDVHLIDDLTLGPAAAPPGVGPWEGGRVDHLGRAVRPLWLKAGGRVREGVTAIKAIAIQGAGPSAGEETGEEAARLRGEGRRQRRPTPRYDLHALPRRCPHAEMDPLPGLDFCADRQLPLHLHPGWTPWPSIWGDHCTKTQRTCRHVRCMNGFPIQETDSRGSVPVSKRIPGVVQRSAPH